MEHENLPYLQPTKVIDSDHQGIRAYAREILGSSKEPIEMAVKLYLAVRDKIRYDPYSPFYLPEHYRASNILKRGRSFCVPKASLLCALGRACQIPTRLGLATIRNHLATKQLIEFLGTDLFSCHGFVELFLEGKWVKATPAFNKELCERHRVPPLEFNGREDSLFHAYNLESQKFMDYLEYHGTFSDVPVDFIVSEWRKVYGEDRIRKWIRMFEEKGGLSLSDFASEDVLKKVWE